VRFEVHGIDRNDLEVIPNLNLTFALGLNTKFNIFRRYFAQELLNLSISWKGLPINDVTLRGGGGLGTFDDVGFRDIVTSPSLTITSTVLCRAGRTSDSSN